MGELQKTLICSDLDRTIIPNGYQEESAHARAVFRLLAQQSNISLAYVSGRDQKLILDAIDEFYLPLPDYAIGDVGTALYQVINGNWQLSDIWSGEIGQEWKGLGRGKVSKFLVNLEEIRLQEPDKQKQYKASFYTDQNVDHQQLIENIRGLLTKKGVQAGIIWSIDEISTKGLVDIIPPRANKLHAIQFLMQQEHFPEDRTIFAGESGNDLDVLTNGLQSILVKNATENIRKEALKRLSEKDLTNRLYLPQGNFFGMNGNYAAGVIEGLAHFMPETRELIAKAVEKIR